MISSCGILTIDLHAIQLNWLLVASRLNSGTECAAVVKADAYSVGAIAVSEALYHVGCRNFYLTTFDEALELRTYLPSDVILYVFGGAREGMEPLFIINNLIPVLYSGVAVKRWLGFCKKEGKAFPCALKLDTGMTRLGLSEAEFASILDILPNISFFNPVLFMSHLACADLPEHPLNHLQLQRFTDAVAKIKAFFPAIKASLANSSGTFLGDEYHFDMVRIGAALYGINPQIVAPNPLRQVLQLRLPVLQLRNVVDDVYVGYGADVLVAAGARLAVVAGGYADGTHRSLGLSPRGQVDGVLVKAVGRVSMDSCIFDITHIETETPEYIEVINSDLTLDYLMQSSKTLGYEVLTSLGQRYERQYVRGIIADE